MEFRFDIKGLFPEPIIRVASNLLPHTFRGDRRQALDATSKISEIIDKIGELSAASQKLSKPITTAQRLRQSENQILYLLAEPNAGARGQVLGLLKVGYKDLYLFDENGVARKVENASCILDFYVHESKQRMGIGKCLFETMLREEKWEPNKLAIDRPSEKLLGFFNKHYGLHKTIPQTNNFVLFEGYFGDVRQDKPEVKQANGFHMTNSPNTQLFGAVHVGSSDDEYKKRRHRQSDSVPIAAPIAPVGRYAAPRPPCRMGEKTVSEASMTPSQSEASRNARKNPLDALSRSTLRQAGMEKRCGLQDVDDEYLKNVFAKPSVAKRSIIHSALGGPSNGLKGTANRKNDVDDGSNVLDEISDSSPGGDGGEAQISIRPTSDFIEEAALEMLSVVSIAGDEEDASQDVVDNEEVDGKDEIIPLQQEFDSASHNNNNNNTFLSGDLKKPMSFRLSKQHTGMKNVSFGVGMAVTPTNKMEFDQEDREDFGIVKINRPIGKLKSPPPLDGDNASTTSSTNEGLTDQGYYDLKFYHNKLW